MTELLSAYYYFMCQVALTTNDIDGFMDKLSLSDECSTLLCHDLMIALDNFHKKEITINPEIENNIRVLIDSLVPKFDKKSQVNMRNELLGNFNLLQSYSIDNVSLISKYKPFLYYIGILKSHSIEVPDFDLASILYPDKYYSDIKEKAKHLVYNDYVILEQLLKLPIDRDYDSISLDYYENSLSFFLSIKGYEPFTQGEDFKQLSDYLKKRTSNEKFLGKTKQKSISIIKNNCKR